MVTFRIPEVMCLSKLPLMEVDYRCGISYIDMINKTRFSSIESQAKKVVVVVVFVGVIIVGHTNLPRLKLGQ